MDGVPVWNEIAATGVERTSSSASDETTSEGAILDDTLNTLDEHNSSALVVAQFNTDTANTAAAVVGSDINCSGPDKSPTAIAQSRLTESITQLIRAELMDGCVVFNINSRHDEFFEFYETATTAGDIAVNSKDLGEIFDTYTVPKMSKAEAIEFAVRFELIRRTAQKRPLGDIDEIRGSIEAAFDKRTFHKLELTHRGVRSMAVSESTSDDSVTEGSEYLNKLELPFKDGVTISSWVDADDAYYYTPIDGDVGFTAHVKP